MKASVIINITKSILALVIVFNALLVQAQENFKKIKRDYFGFTASFATKSSSLSSNYAAIDKMDVLQQGGALGVLWGSRGFQTKLSGGYYPSTDHVAHTTDLVQLEINTNLYPIYMIQKKSSIIEPYFTFGISKSYYKLYGFYTNEQSNLNNNYSVSIEPYLGNLNLYNAVIGAGLEINLLDDYEFCKLFVDARYSSPVSKKSSYDFTQTSASSQVSISVGISFGTNRFFRPSRFGR